MVMAIDPHWLAEAYSDAIAKLDIGLLDRCQILSNVTAMMLKAERLRHGTFLDWAGGYGTLTRLMRDRGYDFLHQDPMATNLFAEGHSLDEIEGRRFDLVTAFEVLEHLADPRSELTPVAATTDRLLATTHLVPDPAPLPQDWWYYTLESGQHISFYTRESLEHLAEHLGFDGVVTGSFVHLFHRGPVSPVTRAWLRSPGAAYAAGLVASLPDRRRSLLDADVEQVKARTAATPP
jgi:Methyltransferase domain